MLLCCVGDIDFTLYPPPPKILRKTNVIYLIKNSCKIKKIKKDMNNPRRVENNAHIGFEEEKKPAFTPEKLNAFEKSKT